MAALPYFGLRERQRQALRDLQLQPHEVDPGHGLGDGMLDLDARVHLQEIELPLLVEQELDGARADIADRLGGADGGRAHARAKFRRDGRGGRFLDDLLMAALDRAIALAHVNDRTVFVAENLHLDMARADQRALQQQPAVAERALASALAARSAGSSSCIA